MNVKNKKIKTISNVHDFFYKQSIYKVGASENNMQLVTEVNQKELISNNYLEKTYEKYFPLTNKNIPFFEKLSKSKLKFNIKKNLLCPLSMFVFILIIGFLLFLIAQSKKNGLTIKNTTFIKEKQFNF